MAKKVEISYNEAYEQIEEIIEKINNEKLDIDSLSKDVKRGIELIEICRAKLRNAEKEVNQLFDKEEE